MTLALQTAMEMRRPCAGKTSLQHCHPNVTFAAIEQRQRTPYFGLAGVKQNRYSPRNLLARGADLHSFKGSNP
jgi:hypothetical protein